LNPNTPELTRIFREEVDERTRRLIEGARLLSAGELAADAVADLVRDAHTIKGSAGLLGYELIRDGATRLEDMWRSVAEGKNVEPGEVEVMQAVAGRLGAGIDDPEDSELRSLMGKVDEVPVAPLAESPEVLSLRSPDVGSLGGLLTSVSESLLGGATRVDTADQ
jgi:HPt (histidine-containing phosphotransfer) domain-containing protein